MVELAAKTITEVAHTGNRSDGKVFVWPIDSALRIRTDELGDAAV